MSLEHLAYAGPPSGDEIQRAFIERFARNRERNAQFKLRFETLEEKERRFASTKILRQEWMWSLLVELNLVNVDEGSEAHCLAILQAPRKARERAVLEAEKYERNNPWLGTITGAIGGGQPKPSGQTTPTATSPSSTPPTSPV